MTYYEFMSIIASSETTDWNYDDERGVYVYLHDISITIKSDREDEEEFYEEWVERFVHHPTATRSRFYLCYNGVIIDTFYTAAVDESRMFIPYPDRETMSITLEQFRIGRIINIPTCNVIDRYEEYLRQAGISHLVE